MLVNFYLVNNNSANTKESCLRKNIENCQAAALFSSNRIIYKKNEELIKTAIDNIEYNLFPGELDPEINVYLKEI